MTLGLALALAQDFAVKTPDTSRYMVAGYAAIGSLLAGYALFLWVRYRRTR
jgi:hypothetical protein